MEEKYVKDIYKEIAIRFDQSRGYYWKGIKNFLLSIDSGIILDMGCGNGKNMLLRKDCKAIGFDFCENNVKICKEKKLEVMIADIRRVPYRNNAFDTVISVAVLHHVKDNRKESVKEMLRVLKPGGLLFLQVWADTVTKTKKFIHIEGNDYFVTWYVNKEKTLKRYYHLFSLDELRNLFEDLNVDIIDLQEELNNYYIIIKKNSY